MDLSEMIEKRRELLDSIDKLKAESTKLTLQILAGMRKQKIDRFPGPKYTAIIREISVYQSFDEKKAEADYPMERYPELYSIDYGKLRAYLARGRRGRSRTKEIEKYLPEKRTTLRVQKTQNRKARAPQGSLTI